MTTIVKDLVLVTIPVEMDGYDYQTLWGNIDSVNMRKKLFSAGVDLIVAMPYDSGQWGYDPCFVLLTKDEDLNIKINEIEKIVHFYDEYVKKMYAINLLETD